MATTRGAINLDHVVQHHTPRSTTWPANAGRDRVLKTAVRGLDVEEHDRLQELTRLTSTRAAACVSLSYIAKPADPRGFARRAVRQGDGEAL